MPTTFDPLKAAREELAGLSEVQRVLVQRERNAEEVLRNAQDELNAIRKITGYVRISLEITRQRMNELEKEQQGHG